MKYQFQIGDRVKIFNTDSFGNVLARYKINKYKKNGYLIDLDFPYENPVVGGKTYGMALIEDVLFKVKE